jgi:hypothetical protein
MNIKTVRNTVVTLVIIHSLYVIYVFWYVHAHQRHQDYLYWSIFFPYFDRPLVDIGFVLDKAFHFTGGATAWWVSLGFSGHNLRHGIIYLIFGGLQWAVIGLLPGMFFGLFSPRDKREKKVQASKRRLRLVKKKVPRDTPPEYVPASVPKDQMLFVDGTAGPDPASKAPPARRSSFLQTESAGFVVLGEKIAYFLNLRVLNVPEEEAPHIRVEYENPRARGKPFIKVQPLPPKSASFQLLSPYLVKGVKAGKVYTIRVSIIKDMATAEPIDLLEQQVSSFVYTGREQVYIKTGIPSRCKSQIMVVPLTEL